jgi:hypothetical protein
MIFTPRHVAEDQPNRTVFYMTAQGKIVSPIYDWSTDLAVNTAKITKEYAFSTAKDTLEDAVIVVAPYYGRYDVTIESLAAVIDAESITA